MDIRILHLLEGAREATGLTVVIDVFRAFTMEAYMYQAGAARTIPVGTVEDAFALKKAHPEYILAGERHGAIVPGFDVGNSPSALLKMDVRGRTIIHTTSAGVQGLVSASGADEIITGALVNAGAAARYIQKKNPAQVSLVAMGLEARKDTEEDVLCAEYIQSILRGHPLKDIRERAEYLRYQEGKKFFDPKQKEVFPEEDFWLAIKVDTMDFVIKVKKENGLFVTEKENI
jgi:2-phosphosulfolactate phosphatase